MNKITPRAQQTLNLARVEAERRGGTEVYSGHVLLALLEFPRGTVFAILKSFGVDSTKAVTQLSEKLASVESPDPGGFSRTLEAVLEKAEEEAKALQDDSIGTVHLLLAILVEAESPEALLLKQWNVTAETIREAAKELNSVVETPPATPELSPAVEMENLSEEVQKMVDKTPSPPWKPELTPEAKNAAIIVKDLSKRFPDESLGLLFFLSFLKLAQNSTVKDLLIKKGVELAKLREEIEGSLKVRSGSNSKAFPTQAPISRIIEKACETASNLNHRRTGIGHFFLVILQDETVFTILGKYGIQAGGAVETTLKILQVMYGPGITAAPQQSFRVRNNPIRAPQKLEKEKPYLHPHFELALQIAIEEAQRLQSSHLNSCHILLGITWVPCGLAAEMLANLGVNLDQLREVLNKVIFNQGNLSPETKIIDQKGACTALARWECHAFRHPCIDDTHLLLAVLRREQHFALHVLQSFGIDYERVRNAILDLEAETSVLLPLSPPAELVVMLAQKKAERLGHSALRTEHLLCGLAEFQSGFVARLFKQTLDLLEFHSALKELVMTVPPESAPGAVNNWENVMKMASQEAWTQHLEHVGVEHLLLGILRVRQCPAAELLRTWELPYQMVRDAINAFEIPPRGAPLPLVQPYFRDRVVVFNEKANAAINLAIHLAARIERTCVACEQLLMAAICLGEGEAIALLRKQFPREVLRIESEILNAPGGICKRKDLPFGQKMNLACQIAHGQAKVDGHAVVDVRHLLLAIFEDELGFREHLTRIGIDLEKVRSQLVKELADLKPKSGESL